MNVKISPEIAHEAKAILRGEYDIPLRDEPKTVLDIGANAGLFSAWARKHWPSANIVAYEPWPENAELFKSNFDGITGVELRDRGVRGFSGRSKMFAGQNACMRTFHVEQGHSLDVDCEDAADIPSAEFVKIDTEGSELEILNRLDLSKTKALACEAHSIPDLQAIRRLMLSRGFLIHSEKPSVNGCYLCKYSRHPSPTQKVFVGIPVYGGIPYETVSCLHQIISNPPGDVTLRLLPGDSLVARARNTITAEFLRTDCTDLLFIDSDLVFSAAHIRRIVSHDVDVVGGFYPKKQQGPLAWVCNAAIHETKPDAGGLQEVRYIGTGFLRVRRAVFDRMATELKIDYHPDSNPTETEWDFWPVGVHESPGGFRRYLSEDWFFCQRWLDLGGKVYGDTQTILKHVGSAVYPLITQIPEISNPSEQPANQSDTCA